MKKKHEVVMLPTNKPSNIWQIGNRLYYHPSGATLVNKVSFQHLYILSDEGIKDGETCWAINTNRDTIYEIKDAIDGTHLYWDKVIASTDKSLGKTNYKFVDNTPSKGFTGKWESIPQIPEAFIPKYIEAYNAGKPIEWVNLEYEVDKYDERNQYQDCPSGKYWMDEPLPKSPDRLYTDAKYFILKLRSDNSVIITKIQDIFTREEMIDNIHSYVSGNHSDYKGYQHVIKWLNENH